MKLACHSRDLAHVLTQVIRIVPNNNTIPMLAYLRLDATDTTLTVTATDLISWIQVRTDKVKITEPGSMLLEAHRFYRFLIGLAEPIALGSSDAGINVRFAASKYLFKAPPLDQYPAMPDLDPSSTHQLDAETLREALRVVKPAAARDAFNAKLQQVGIRHGKVQAADGIRFHEVEVPGTEHLDIAMPLMFLDDAVALLGSDADTTLSIGVPADNDALLISYGATTLRTARKINPFPDVSAAFLVPAMTNNATLRVERDTLVDTIRRVRILADPETNAVTLRTRNFSELDVTARQPSGANARETIPAEWSGDDRTLTFDHDQLLQLLRLFNDPQLNLRLGVDQRHKPTPLLIQQSGRSGVLMQLRTERAA